MMLNTGGLNRRTFLKLTAVGLLGLSLAPWRSSLIKAQQGRLSWSKAAELPGGHMTAIVVSPSDPRVLYLSSNANAMGVWKSEDGGASWSRVLYDEKVGVEVDVTHTLALALHPANPEIVYATDLHGKINRTTDGGISWETTYEDGKEAGISLSISPTNPRILYAGVQHWGSQEGPILKSLDGGRSWRQVSVIPTSRGIKSIAVDPLNPDIVYAGTGTGIYKTLNGGRNWGRISPSSIQNVMALAIDPSDSDRILAATDRGIFKSGDGGESWKGASTGLTELDVHSIALSPSNTGVIYAGTRGGVFKSEDGGGRWIAINNGIEFRDIGAVAVHPRNPDIAFAGTNIWQWNFHRHSVLFPEDTGGEGVYKTTNGGESWAKSDKGFVDVDVNSIALDPSDPDTVYVGTECSRGLYASTDGGNTWRLRAGGPEETEGEIAHYTMVVIVDPSPPHPLYLTGRFGIGKSLDGGRSWQDLFPGRLRHFHGIAVDPTNPDVMFLGTGVGGPEQPYPGAHILKSTNGGRTWREQDEGFPHGADTSVHTFAIDPSDPETVYVATTSHEEGLPRSSTTLGIYKTNDGGERWSEANSGLLNREVLALAIDPSRPQVLYAGTEQGVFKTADAARRWRMTSLIGVIVYALVIDPTNPQLIYAGTERGLFFSEDGGTRWQRVTEVPAQVVKGVSVAPTGEIAYAAVNDVGVFKGVK